MQSVSEHANSRQPMRRAANPATRKEHPRSVRRQIRGNFAESSWTRQFTDALSISPHRPSGRRESSKNTSALTYSYSGNPYSDVNYTCRVSLTTETGHVFPDKTPMRDTRYASYTRCITSADPIWRVHERRDNVRVGRRLIRYEEAYSGREAEHACTYLRAHARGETVCSGVQAVASCNYSRLHRRFWCRRRRRRLRRPVNGPGTHAYSGLVDQSPSKLDYLARSIIEGNLRNGAAAARNMPQQRSQLRDSPWLSPTSGECGR